VVAVVCSAAASTVTPFSTHHFEWSVRTRRVAVTLTFFFASKS
jgi:dolichol kinase